MKVREKGFYEAIHYVGNAQELHEIAVAHRAYISLSGSLCVGGARLNVGDYLLTDSKGQSFVCNPTYFEANYERVPETFLQTVEHFTEDIKRFS